MAQTPASGTVVTSTPVAVYFDKLIASISDWYAGAISAILYVDGVSAGAISASWYSNGISRYISASGSMDISGKTNGASVSWYIVITYQYFYTSQQYEANGTETSATYTVTKQLSPAAFALTAPADAAVQQSLTPTLSWVASTNATTYDVYCDTSNPPTTKIGADQAGITKVTSALTQGALYYWKVVAKNTIATQASAVWSFRVTATASKATTPSPASAAVEVSRNPVLSWVDGGVDGYGPATSYNVYFGTDPTPDASELQGNQAGTTFNPGTLKVATVYYWRIDSVNAAGTTTGDIWSFTTSEIPTGTPAARHFKRLLVAAADNKFFYEDDSVPPKMIELSGLVLDTEQQLSMTEAYQKMFIANNDKLKVVDFSNTILHIATGITYPPANGDILAQAATGASMVVDFVNADKTKVYGFVITAEEFNLTAVDANYTINTAFVAFTPTSITKINSEVLLFDALTTTPVAGDVLTQATKLTVAALATAPAVSDVLTQTNGYDTYTKFLSHFDGIDAETIDQTAATGQTIALEGTAQLDTAQKKFGTASLLLDGDSDYATVPDNDNWDFSGGVWSIDCWIRTPSLAAEITIFSQSTDANNHTWGRILTSGVVVLDIRGSAGAGTVVSFQSTNTVAVDTWNHIAFVEDGDNYHIFVNGIKTTAPANTGRPINYTGLFQIGRHNTSGYFNGWIDEFRISKGIARWTANFDVPTAAYSNATRTLTVTSVSTTNIFGYATGVMDTWNGFVSNGTISPAYIVPLTVTGGNTVTVLWANTEKTQIAYESASGTIYQLAGYVLKSDNAGATMSPVNIQPVGAVSSRIPHYYDWTKYPDLDGGDADQFGSIFEKATICCMYLGKLFLSGNPDYPHQFQLSRQAVPWDFQYFANDAQSAIGGVESDLGRLGDIIVAAIPYSNDYLVIGCDNSIWVLRGDPAAGGSVDQIGFTTGIWGKDSWCWDSQNNLYFLGANGIYRIPAGLGEPVNITKDVVPEFMNEWNLDKNLHNVTMAFDQNKYGINICKTDRETGENQNYWYDLRVGTDKPGGLFPETYPDECGVFSAHFYAADDNARKKSLLGCKDGYIRYFDDESKDDDIGTTVQAIESDVLLGPIPISANSSLAAITNGQTFVTAGGGVGGSQADTDSITYQIFIAKTAEEIIEQVTATTPDPLFSGTITGPGKAKRKIHRARGVFMGIRILNITANETWAIDRVLCDIKDVGKVR